MWPFKSKEFRQYFGLKLLPDISIDSIFSPNELRVVDALDRFYFGNIKDGESVLGSLTQSCDNIEESFLLRLALLSARQQRPFVPRIQTISWGNASSSRASYAIFPGDIIVRCYIRNRKTFLTVTNKHSVTRTILVGWLSDNLVLNTINKIAEQKRSGCCSSTGRLQHVI